MGWAQAVDWEQEEEEEEAAVAVRPKKSAGEFAMQAAQQVSSRQSAQSSCALQDKRADARGRTSFFTDKMCAICKTCQIRPLFKKARKKAQKKSRRAQP